jgi:hypothetical protein
MKDAYLHPVSRRQALKGIAAAGATTWATPVVASIGLHTRSGSLCPDCSPACGGNNARCEGPGPPPQDPCICAQRHEGGCVCVDWDAPLECRPCLTDAQCEPHEFCMDIVPPCEVCFEDPQPPSICRPRCQSR